MVNISQQQSVLNEAKKEEKKEVNNMEKIGQKQKEVKINLVLTKLI